MTYGTISDRYTDKSALLRNRAEETLPADDDQQPRMGIRSAESVEPQGYLSRAGDLICSVPRQCQDSCRSILSRPAVILTPFSWLVENRLGFAKVAGIPLLLSQVLPWLGKNFPNMFPPDFPRVPGLQESREIVEAAFKAGDTYGFRTEPLQIKHGSGILHGVICYPPDWDPNKSQCILYHNPNAIVISQFLVGGYLDPTSAPGRIQSEKKYPVILYDYRGTGLNKFEGRLGNLPFSTCETIVQDGVAAVVCALEKFERVYVAGSSLGGGVATASLARHLEASGGLDDARVELLSHDSFTTTSRVIMPGKPRLADFLGWLVGGNLDAEAAMRILIEHNINIVSLNHLDDPVIPKGVHMSEFIESLYPGGRESGRDGGRDSGRIVAREFSGYSHGELTAEMARYL